MMPPLALVLAVLAFAGAPRSTAVTCTPAPVIPAGAGAIYPGTSAYAETLPGPPPAILLGAYACADLRSRVAATRANAVFVLFHEAIHVRLLDAGLEPSVAEECEAEGIEEHRIDGLLVELFPRGRELEYAEAAAAVFATRERFALGCAPAGIQVRA